MGCSLIPLYQASDGKMVILQEETYKRFGYYPRELASQSHKQILATCDNCGIVRETSKHAYRALCRSCSSKGKHHSEETRKKIGNAQKGERNHNFGKHPSERIRKKMGDARRGKTHSIETRRKISNSNKGKKGENSSNWKGGTIKRKCQECEKKFEVQRYLLKKGWGKYCCLSCASKAKRKIARHKSKPKKTQPELIFESICKRNRLSFHFVGDGSLWIGKKSRKQLNPDFIEANGKKVLIEIMGDYWHSPLLNRNLKEYTTLEYRKKHYMRYRWIPVFIWESDLKRKDAEQFVLNELKKYHVL